MLVVMFREFAVHDVFKDENGIMVPGGVGGIGFGVDPGGGLGVDPGGGLGVDPGGGLRVDPGVGPGGISDPGGGVFLVNPTPKPTPITTADPIMQETIMAILYWGCIA
jgi:hypothetical protein